MLVVEACDVCWYLALTQRIVALVLTLLIAVDMLGLRTSAYDFIHFRLFSILHNFVVI